MYIYILYIYIYIYIYIYSLSIEVRENRTDVSQDDSWTKVGTVRHLDSKPSYTFSVRTPFIEPDKDYNFRVNTIADNSGKPQRDSFTGGPVSEIVNNPCTGEYGVLA